MFSVGKTFDSAGTKETTIAARKEKLFGELFILHNFECSNVQELERESLRRLECFFSHFLNFISKISRCTPSVIFFKTSKSNVLSDSSNLQKSRTFPDTPK